MQKVINSGKKKVYQFHRFLSNRDINTVERRLLLVLVLCPTNKNMGGKCGHVIDGRQLLYNVFS